MHKEGHIGAALLAYAPIAFLAAIIGSEALAFMGVMVAAGLAMVPDLDMRVPLVPHRGPTHTAWFAVGVGHVVGIVGGFLGFQSGILFAIGFFVFGTIVGIVTIASHIVADALTPLGVRPFKPWQSTMYSWGWFKASNPIANYAMLGLSVTVTSVAGGAGLFIRSLF